MALGLRVSVARVVGISLVVRNKTALSPTGSALLRTDLSPLTNGILQIHAECSCYLRLQL